MAGWLTLFHRATAAIDAAAAQVGPFEWTLGGGTMLWLRYRHRESHDIDVFLDDPQLLGALSPRLNSATEAMLADCRANYVEQSHFLKLAFAEGDVDFVVAPHLTTPYAEPGAIDGREVMIETPREILAKKLLYRAGDFAARDLFDFAFLIEKSEAGSLILSDPRTYVPKLHVIADRVRLAGEGLRRSFDAIHAIGYRPSFAHCIDVVSRFTARHASLA